MSLAVPDSGTLSLALGAGLVAAVNPCGFALLPAYLSILVLDEYPTRVVAVERALRATTAMTAGFTAVFALFGLAVTPVAASVRLYLPGFTVVLGLALAAAGVWVIIGRRLPTLHLRGRRGGTARPLTGSLASMAGFGASYAVASLGCTIAPFLAVVVVAFRAGSIGEGLVLFAAYALGMGLVVGTAAVTVAMARTALIGQLRRTGAVLPRLGGGLLVLAGGYVAWYGAWELRVLHSNAGADRVVNEAARLQQWLTESVQRVGAGGFLIGLLGLTAAAWLLGRARPRNADTGSPEGAPPSSRSPHTSGEAVRMQAIWNGHVVAESDDTVVVDRYHYFPEGAVHREYFTPSTSMSICPWKGKASYYHLTVDGQTNPDAAWQYRHPLPIARKVKYRVAFWHGVQVTPAAGRDSQATR